MKFIKSFELFEGRNIKNTDEILTIAGKKVDITKLTSKQQKDIFGIISQFDTKLSEKELLKTVELYIMSIS